MILWELVYSAFAGAAIYSPLSSLLLLSSEAAHAAALRIFSALAAALFLSILGAVVVIWRRRSVIETLGVHRVTDQALVAKLNDDPWVLVNLWAFNAIFCVNLTLVVFRPEGLSVATSSRAALFATIVVAAAALPLLMLIRREFVRILAEIPAQAMAEIIDALVKGGRLRGRTSRRLLAAIVTPVAFLAIGAGLITGAHLHDSKLKQRKEVIQILGPLSLQRIDKQAGDETAVLKNIEEIFARYGHEVVKSVSTDETIADFSAVKEQRGQEGSGLFLNATSRSPDSLFWPAIPVSLAALALAAWAGIALGGRLSIDLRMATRGVGMLGTEAALEGTRVMRPARFVAVSQLGSAIEMLANRFRLFARAQERAIDARAAATKARGRFFASVSHDLKSPLNAILGFAELTNQSLDLNEAQHESLSLITASGRELHLLVGTILDAARVEAGQLHLDLQPEPIGGLVEDATEKATALTALYDTQILHEIPSLLPEVTIDRLRLSQALATLIAFGRRHAQRKSLRVLVLAEAKIDNRPRQRRRVTIHIELPSSRLSAQELEGLLSPEIQPGKHRGEALALRLAVAIISLHGGKLSVTGHTVREPAFAIELPGRLGT